MLFFICDFFLHFFAAVYDIIRFDGCEVGTAGTHFVSLEGIVV